MSDSSSFVLYIRPFCGFCTRVKRFLTEAEIDIPERDIWTDEGAGDELKHGGGSTQVPCLRIENDNGDVNWLYESTDIITYLSRE